MYKSKYSPGKEVTAHQYIVELVCENRAKKLDRDLPVKFWELQEWRTYFIVQSKKCAELREKFYDEAILRAVKEYKIYNLSPKWIENIIAKHQLSIDAYIRDTKNAKSVNVIENPILPQAIIKKSVIDKIKDLE